MKIINFIVIIIMVFILSTCQSVGDAKEYTYQKGNYIVVDYSLPKSQKRFFIYDRNHNLIFKTYVAHGVNSGRGEKPTSFSNEVGSKKSSLGTYRIGEVYRGKNGISIRLDGLSPSNSRARHRAIVLHPARYVRDNGEVGNSEGCFAVPVGAMKVVLKLIKQGDKLYARA